MTQAPLQIDFRPQPRGIAVVTSAPISSIVENGRYSAFQDLIDGYASSFAKVLVLTPNGEPTVAPSKAHRVSWFSGPRWLSPTNGLWWAALANRQELRNVDLVRTFGPRAGIVGRALSKLSKSPHVSTPDDLVGNTWRDRARWRAILPRFVSRLGILRADVLSATLDWELEYLAETGYKNDVLLGSIGLATGIYTPVSMTDPGRHPVVMWVGSIADDDSVSLLEQVAASTQKMIQDVEFIVVAQGDAADRLRTTSTEHGLPVTVASYEEVEPLVDLVERTWACVTVPAPNQRKFPHGLAMLALSAGIPLISMGELGEKHGFQNHLNYVRVEQADHRAVVYGLQLLRRWTTFALRIGSAGQRLVEERYSTRSVALVEGERLARIATDQDIELATSDAAQALQEFDAQLLPEVHTAEKVQYVGGEDSLVPSLAEEIANGAAETDSAPDTPPEAPQETVGDGSAAFELVAAAIAAVNGENVLKPGDEKSNETPGETQLTGAAPIGAGPTAAGNSDASNESADSPEVSIELDADDHVDEIVGADMIAASSDEAGVPAESGETSDQPEASDTGELELTPMPELIADELEVDDDLPQIKLVKVSINDISSGKTVEENTAGSGEEPGDVPGELDQDVISASFAADNDGPDGTEELPAGPAPAPDEKEAPDPLDQDVISASFAADNDGSDDTEELPAGPAPAPDEQEAPDPLDQDVISASFAASDEDDQAA